MAIRIFLSHAAFDETLATALVDCLCSCMIIKDEEIRCTSVPGHKLPVGSETAAILRDELGDTSVVIGLLTPKAIASGWVPFELGASWGARKNLVPLLAGGLAFKDLPGPLSGHHAIKLSDKNGLAQAMEEISTKIRAKTRTAAKRDAAIAKLAAVAEQYEKASEAEGFPKGIHKLPPEPTFAGIQFSELFQLLGAEKIKVPAGIASEKMILRCLLAKFWSRITKSSATAFTVIGTWTKSVASCTIRLDLRCCLTDSFSSRSFLLPKPSGSSV